MKVIFDYGLFTKGVALSTDARADLQAIATTLKAKGNRFHVEVEGHTDSVRTGSAKTAAANNRSLGLARARTVSSYLTKYCGLAVGSVTATTSGDTNPPYPNTSLDNRKRNRTAVLRITVSNARQP